jgi:hypothetical protein
MTALGHSYGSLLVGEAAKQPGGIPVNDIVFIGSPGVSVDHANQLNIDPAHVWAGAAANDPVPQLPGTWDAAESGGANLVNSLAGLNAFKDLTGADVRVSGADAQDGHFGLNPALSEFGAKAFYVAPGDPTPDAGLGIIAGQMPAHSQYWEDGFDKRHAKVTSDSVDSMTKVVLGDYGSVRLVAS